MSAEDDEEELPEQSEEKASSNQQHPEPDSTAPTTQDLEAEVSLLEEQS